MANRKFMPWLLVATTSCFYTYLCVQIIHRPPQVPFPPLSTWNAGMKNEVCSVKPLQASPWSINRHCWMEAWSLVLNQAFAQSPAGSRAGASSISPPEIFQFLQRLCRWISGSLILPEMFSNSWSMLHCPFEDDTGWGPMCHAASQEKRLCVLSPGRTLEETPRAGSRCGGNSPGSQMSHHNSVSSCTPASVTRVQHFEHTKHFLQYP